MENILNKIRETIGSINPAAKVILYGSSARGDCRSDSDIDLLILVNDESIFLKDKKKIKYALYDIEIETGQLISPLILSQNEWEKRHKMTPFYESVNHEGILL